MTDPFLPVSAPTRIPGQRAAADHPMRPELAEPPLWSEPPSVRESTGESYAHWWRRVLASLIDALLAIPFWAAGVIGAVTFADSTTFLTDGTGGLGSIQRVVTSTGTWVGGGLAVGAYLGLIVFSFWNQVVRQGRRGASIGKACLQIMVVDDQRGRPIGALLTFVRAVAHVLDAVPFYLGYLWPLVDRRRQTFADMVMGTVVLHLPPLPARPTPQVPAQATAPYGW
jgi:uncharacterized RDD family membrane protein YckC